MDSNRIDQAADAFRGAVSPTEVADIVGRDLRDAMETPAEEQAFIERLSERFGLPIDIGAVVVAAERETTAERAFVRELEDFIHSGESQEMSAETQLNLMGRFWEKLGFAIPTLTGEQHAQIEAVIEANPGKRVVPTPLLDHKGRLKLASLVRGTFPRNQLHETKSPLYAPKESSAYYGRFLRNFNTLYKRNDGGGDAIFYRAPKGKLLSRPAYITALLEAGQAVEGADGTIWTFPVMDVRVRTPRVIEHTSELHGRIDPIETPESALVAHILHQAIGSPNLELVIDVVNETVYRVDREHKPVGTRIVGVRYRADNRQITIGTYSANLKEDYFRSRGAVSGISKDLAA